MNFLTRYRIDMVYKAYRIIDGKAKWIVIDDNGTILDRNPNEEELKRLKLDKSRKSKKRYSDEELINYLRQFYEEEGMVPHFRSFDNNPRYPGHSTYMKRFGSWNNAIEKAGLQDMRILNRAKKYSDNVLFEYLRQYHRENGRPPVASDLRYNSRYPALETYINRFSSWNNSLKLVELDIESMIKKNIIETSNQKARLAEILVRDHFKTNPIDLSGKNCNSPYDGICPNGKIYDVKSAKLSEDRWLFNFTNKYKDRIEIYYLLAFDENFDELLYAWRIPTWDFADDIMKNFLRIGKWKIKNMIRYDCTDKFKNILLK